MNDLIDIETNLRRHVFRLHYGIIRGNTPVACNSTRALCDFFAPIEAMKPTLPRAPWIEARA